MKGLKNESTSILNGYQIFHNYIRPQEALCGKTPADVAGIKVEGENKWANADPERKPIGEGTKTGEV